MTEDPSAIVVTANPADFDRLCFKYELDGNAMSVKPGAALYGYRIPKVVVSCSVRQYPDLDEWINRTVMCRIMCGGTYIREI